MSSVHENEKHNDEKFKYADVECVEDAGKEEAADAGSSARLDPEVAKYAAGEIVEIDEATNQRLLKMINVRILPVMVFSYFLQSLDKGTMSFSSIMGLPEDAGLVGQQYSWLTTCIYIAVLVVEYPINWLIQRLPIAKFFAFNICAWSIVLAFHALCHNFLGLVIVRTLLGIFEASCQPVLMFMSSMWYKRSEQPMIVTLWFMMNGFQQIVGGLLAYAFTHIGRDSPILSWQALFLTYGCFTFLWGLYVLVFMPDSPMRAKCFSEEDKKLMIERVRSNQTGIQNKKFRIEQLYEALKDPQCWTYAAVNFFTALPNSGINAFANLIISGFGFTVLETQLLAMVLGAYMMFCQLSSTYFANRYGNTLLIMIAYVVPSIAGTIVLMVVPNTTKATQIGLLICYYLVVSFWGAQTLSLSLLTRNVGGQTKKAVATAMNFIFWAAGNAIGPQLLRSQDAPRYFLAFAIHIGCYVALIIWLFLVRLYFIHQNKKKAAYLEEHKEALDKKGNHSFDDLTDIQNPNFVYTY